MRTRPSAAAVLVGALALGSSLVPGPAAAVSTDQSYWVPVSKRLTVSGHGFGHGHGMSQYGAQGAALKGLTHAQILDFYYPGTTPVTARGKIRVLITSDTTDDVMVSPAPGLTVRDLGSGTRYPLPEIDGVRRWRLGVDAAGRTVVAYLTTGWHRWRPDGLDSLAGDGEFSATGPLILWTPTGAKRLRGAVRAASPRPGAPARDTVNVLSLDAYVQGVIPDEMPASWHPEAVKAQAVAARTYGVWSRSQNPRRYYQICDTTSCQVYGGLGAEDPRSNAAVRATARQILTFDGRPAFTQFSSSSGGWTSAGSVPYLPAQADPYDRFVGNPVHAWSTTVDVSRLERSYPRLGTLSRIRVTSRDGNGEWRGRVWSMVLDGTQDDVTISGDTFRWLFGLRSSWFTIEPTPIMARWSRLGAERSTLGEVSSREYAVPSGSAQSFARGRIYHSPRTGARELYGPVLAGYRSLGGPSSWLGLPTTGVRPSQDGFRARFQRGFVWTSRRTGTVPVPMPIADRYRDAGATRSELGWPLRYVKIARGARVEFEHGRIVWFADSGTTRLRLS